MCLSDCPFAVLSRHEPFAQVVPRHYLLVYSSFGCLEPIRVDRLAVS